MFIGDHHIPNKADRNAGYRGEDHKGEDQGECDQVLLGPCVPGDVWHQRDPRGNVFMCALNMAE